MQSRLTIVGQPVHPLLVMFPLGLLVTAVIFDAADLLGGPVILGEVAFSCIAGGLIGGLVAALVGLVDLVAVPDGTRAKRVGVLHGLVNLGVVLLFAVVWMVRMGADHRHAGWGLFAVELVALAGVGLGVRFGGQLVDRLGGGADGNAHLHAAGLPRRRDINRLGPLRSAR
jgi:uncharacterized membrane protein